MDAGSDALNVLLRLFASFYQILVTIILLNLVRGSASSGSWLALLWMNWAVGLLKLPRAVGSRSRLSSLQSMWFGT